MRRPFLCGPNGSGQACGKIESRCELWVMVKGNFVQRSGSESHESEVGGRSRFGELGVRS